ncbi:hypothetical protein RD792_007917 [Penstemon davidsonii]|uniref:DNA2/NAM7 helicase-like C-terminal domain-containing protein n=1 Tax=Penstemon davidsonii TaxID=160366 RepID=A0ABR0D7N1_9LAMI|nr:hypothetical protein RD792_007917 [Penstemon davidsonii]
MDDLIRDKEFRLLFVGILGWDEQERRNPSWFNRIDASKVVEITRFLIEQKGVNEENVGVITPYSQQDPHWNELLWYCVDKGCYQGCFFPEKAEDIPKAVI